MTTAGRMILARISLFLALCCTPCFSDAQPNEPMVYFLKFVQDYGRVYEPSEFTARFHAFERTLANIQRLNEANPLASFGVNQFADFTDDELKALRGSVKPSVRKAVPHLPSAHPGHSNNSLPESVDWRTKGAITPVKNQGKCGSCWAFSATEEIESMWFLAGHPLTVLSPQQIVSCDNQDYGCGGGWPSGAYEYVENAGGMERAADYPYTAKYGFCLFNASEEVAGLSVTGYAYAGQGDEAEMAAQMAAVGPISVCVDGSTWPSYTGGILTECGRQTDHCVQAVGYGTSAGGTDYWLVRNSWGASWGQDGYIQVLRGNNTCAIASSPTIVQLG